MIFDIRDYNAVGDGETMNTAAIQAAVDACFENGGGRVLIAGGTYKTGSFTLKSNVELHIAANGVLLGSEHCEDYPEKTDLKHVDSKCLPRRRNACLIFAEEAENIAITGMGKIDGNGTYFVTEQQGDWFGWKYVRIDAPTPPRMVFFTGCKNIRIEDVTMVNQPAGWGYWIHDCDYVSFDKCKIFAELRYPNNDGIHINSSRNVTISNCNITCGDDCIIVRANNASLAENKVCEKVTVTNCNLTTYANGIRIGWINDGVIRNCTFSNIVMTDTNTGIVLKLPYSGDQEYVPGNCPDDLPLHLLDRGREATTIENISFDNIVMEGIYASPINIAIVDCVGTKCNTIRNIYFNNIHASGLEFPVFAGRKDNFLKNITLSNCTFEKLSDEDLPDYRHHGAAAWDRPVNNVIFSYAENVVVNNTSFTAK